MGQLWYRILNKSLKKSHKVKLLLTGIFVLAHNLKNLEKFFYIELIGILLISNVFIFNLFSSQMLSITIRNPFVKIDSIEDLESMPHLIPVLFAHQSSLPSLLVKVREKQQPISL